MDMPEGNQQIVGDTLPFARSYQLEALQIALKGNTIVFLETGTGKTLIAIMLLRSFAHLLKKPSPHIAVFLVPTVVLVAQQAEVVALHTDLKVGKLYGEMGVDFWDGATWQRELEKFEVLVMTPQILLDALRHTFLRLDLIKVLIFDECHNARGKHPYACIMTEIYHPELALKSMQLPRVYGMTASPIKAKASSCGAEYLKQIRELENLMHSKVFETMEEDLKKLADEHISSLSKPCISPSVACLEACKELHRVGSLTDNLVPDIVEEETGPEEFDDERYLDERNRYFPQELIGTCNESETLYYCYSIELQPNFQYDVKPQQIVLAVQKMLDQDLGDYNFNLDADRGEMIVHVKLFGKFILKPKEVTLCQQFQVKLFDLLLNRNLDKINEGGEHCTKNDQTIFNYLVIPAMGSHGSIEIDWRCICSVLYPKNTSLFDHTKCSRGVHTKNGLVCCCILENSLVGTPHNGALYCTMGSLDDVRGDTYFTPRNKEPMTYKEYYKLSHGISLKYERENLLKGKKIFTVHNYLQRCRVPKKKGQGYSSCELPPELCTIVMSPISISTFYSFSFLPTIMHRIESMLLAANLKSIPMGHSMDNVEIPAIKVLEAITTKKCQEELHLESLEVLGDSFLKYAASQQLFKTHQNQDEGFLSLERERIISNAALCKLGCNHKIPGFIRNEPFDLKMWMIPGAKCCYGMLDEEQISTSRKVYTLGTRELKGKRVADVVEALIGAFLSAAGEIAALSFLVWLGIEVNFETVPYERTLVANPGMHVNISHLESLVGYSFRDASLLLEALTHGSYMHPEIPGCYQRLEFLGDAVLDYLITVHLYHKYPGLSPGMLTDLRSASVNNDCYALSAIRAGLHKHVLHHLPDFHRHIAETINKSDKLLHAAETFGWESETTLPKVLGDVMESLAGAIFIDSGHDKETVFRSLKPLLEPMVTIETLRLEPKRELNQLCQKEKFTMHNTVYSRQEGMACATVEVEARGTVHRETRSAKKNRKLAERLACKDILKSLKESMDGGT